MTEFLHMRNCYLKEFDAKVIDKGRDDNGLFVILNRTAFYPASGGQLSDTGIIISGSETVNVKHLFKEKHYIDKEIKEKNLVIHFFHKLLTLSFKPARFFFFSKRKIKLP